MYDSDEKIDKIKIEAAVQLEDGTDLLGYLFVQPLQRVSDMLNDSRQFLPLQLSDGPLVHLHKSKIAKVSQLAQEPDQEAAFDPYEILGVSPAASDQKLKETYHSLCSAYHPDKLQGLGLPSDFNEIANSRIVRIIDAYRRITAAREGANGKDKASPFSPVP
ncbi:MAG: DnaJ domain-containing protein [Kiloniellales bacterium]